jgi:hypothetical protein
MQWLFTRFGQAEFPWTEYRRGRQHHPQVTAAVLPQYVRQYRGASRQSGRQSIRFTAHCRRHRQPTSCLARRPLGTDRKRKAYHESKNHRCHALQPPDVERPFRLQSRPGQDHARGTTTTRPKHRARLPFDSKHGTIQPCRRREQQRDQPASTGSCKQGTTSGLSLPIRSSTHVAHARANRCPRMAGHHRVAQRFEAVLRSLRTAFFCPV